MTVPLPAGCRLHPAPDVRTRANGRTLIGGAPLTFLRLTDAGASTVRRWFAGGPVGTSNAHQALARRLIRVGMAHPRPESPEPRLRDLTIVIPVKDDLDGLTATLDHLSDRPCKPSGEDNHVQIIVVDDGSVSPVSLGDLHGARDVTVARNPWPSGPAAARQRGLTRVRTPLVAFVDAGVLVSCADLQRLLVALADPAVVAVAPRVASQPSDHLIGRYEQKRSPLDMGQTESLVAPGRRVPYVPTACLVARCRSLDAAGGFDPVLRYGEDVDVVWRLGDLGQVRYMPTVVATHPPRSAAAAMVAQRHGYGSAAAPLAARHGATVAPCAISPWSLLVCVLAALGRPLSAAGVAFGTGVALRPKISPLPNVTVEALLLACRGHWYAYVSLLTALVRTWAPLAALGMVVVPSQRNRLTKLILAGFARRLLDGPRDPGEAVADLWLGAVDDLAYCSGVWAGVLRTRSAKALLPAFTSWPKPGTTVSPAQRTTRAVLLGDEKIE